MKLSILFIGLLHIHSLQEKVHNSKFKLSAFLYARIFDFGTSIRLKRCKNYGWNCLGFSAARHDINLQQYISFIEKKKVAENKIISRNDIDVLANQSSCWKNKRVYCFFCYFVNSCMPLTLKKFKCFFSWGFYL